MSKLGWIEYGTYYWWGIQLFILKMFEGQMDESEQIAYQSSTVMQFYMVQGLSKAIYVSGGRV